MRILFATLFSILLSGSSFAAVAVTADAVQTRIAAAIAARAPAPGRYRVTLSDSDFRLQLPGTSVDGWQIANLVYNPAQQSFQATLSFINDLGNPEYTSISGAAYPVVSVPALSHDLLAGEPVTRNDITSVEIPFSRLGSTLITSPDALLGQVARRNLLPNAPLFVFDLAKPILVKKGELLTITFEIPGIQLSAQAQATSNAAKGDTITVMNTTSKRMIEARITGPGTAVIAAPASSLAASK